MNVSLPEVVNELFEDPSQFERPVYRVFVGSAMTSLPKTQAKEVEAFRRVIKSEFERCRFCSFTVYDPGDHTPPIAGQDADTVFRADSSNLIQADLYVCLATHPSTGQGMENVMATQALVPRLLLCRSDFRPSKMLEGIRGIELGKVVFNGSRDLQRELRSHLRDIFREVTARAPAKRERLKELVLANWGRSILKRRLRSGITRAQLSQKALVSADQIATIELDEFAPLIVLPFQFHVIAHALEAMLASRPGRMLPMFVDSDSTDIEKVMSESLNAMVEFVLCDRPNNDRLVVKMWNDYAELQHEALAGRNPLDDPVTEGGWRILYRKSNRSVLEG